MYFIETEAGKMDIFQFRNTDRRIDLSIFNIPKSTKNYLVCFTGRSGSTMLCSLLKRTKVMGQPDEFTNPRGPMQMYLSKFPATDIIQYFELLRRSLASDNGIFGMKSTYLDFEPLLSAGLVGRCLNPLRWIYLTRRDLVLQAISFVRARQSQIWHRMKNQEVVEDGSIPDSTYDEEAIIAEIDGLISHQHQWERFFTFYSIDPLRISYEDLLEDTVAVMEKVAEFLDVELPHEMPLLEAETQKLGDDVNIQWAEKFRANYTT